MAPSLGDWAERRMALDKFAVSQRYPGVAEPKLDLARAAGDVRELVESASRECTRT